MNYTLRSQAEFTPHLALYLNELFPDFAPHVKEFGFEFYFINSERVFQHGFGMEIEPIKLRVQTHCGEFTQAYEEFCSFADSFRRNFRLDGLPSKDCFSPIPFSAEYDAIGLWQLKNPLDEHLVDILYVYSNILKRALQLTECRKSSGFFE